MAITRRGASSSRSEPSSSRSEQSAELKNPKRQKQSDPKHSEIAAVVDDVMEDQGVELSSENDVSYHEISNKHEIEMDEEESLPLQSEKFFFSPEDYDFVERVFGTRGVKVNDVEEMLDSMEDECGGDQLQVRKFHWGRITFEDIMKEIDHLMKKRLYGKVRVDHLFPGFIVPLEDIISILQPSAAEDALLLDFMERAEAEDSMDTIADGWNERLDVQQKKICWEDLHKVDVDYRGYGEGHVPAAEHMEEPQQNVPAAEHMEEGA
ncbi:unnamed protein product, partial [Arabidopsis halleri]